MNHHDPSLCTCFFISSQVAEVEMPRLCQEARGLLPMALMRAPDTAVTSASGAEKRRGRAITRGHIIRDKADTINCPSLKL